MAVEENRRVDESWWDRITRDLAVGFATTMAALYAVGLLIVNLDLGRYGVFAVDLASPEYVMVGLLWTILVTLTSMVICVMIWPAHATLLPVARSKYVETIRRVLLFLFLSPVLVLYIWALMIVCGDTNFRDFVHPWFLYLVMGLVIQAGVISVEIWAFRYLKGGGGKSILIPVSPPPEESESWDTLLFFLQIFLAIGSSISLGLLGLFSYTRLVYPQIPRQWGGGAKPVVELFLTEKLPVLASRKDIPSTTDGRRIGPVICILESDRMVMIASLNYWTNKDPETVAIDRKVVTAVVYEGLSPDFGGNYSDRSEISSNRPASTSPSPVAASPNPTSSPPVAH